MTAMLFSLFFQLCSMEALAQSTPPPGVPEVSLSVASSVVTEDGSLEGELVLTRSGPISGDLFVALNFAGTAVLGDDYLISPASIVIPDMATSASFRVVGVPDLSPEGEEEIQVSILPDSGYTIGASNNAVLSIQDDGKYIVSVSSIEPVVDEGSSTEHATFRVTRGVAASTPLFITYALKGTATNTLDYELLTGFATIPAGQSYVDVNVIPINDGLVEGNETVEVEILEGAYYSVGVPAVATALILESPSGQKVSVEVADGVASEDSANTASFLVTREGETTEPLVVYYNVGGTATFGADYVSLPLSVTIPAGQSSAVVSIIPIDDSETEQTETVIVSLSSNCGFEIDPLNAKAQVVILDNDPVLVRTEVRNGRSYESGYSTGQISISRTGDLSSALTISVAVSGTAQEGLDYPSVGVTKTFGVGQSEVLLDFPALSDSEIEGPEYLRLRILPGSGYSVGQIDRARIEFVDATYQILGTHKNIQDLSLSGNGMRIVFSSDDPNIVPGDTNGVSDIFIANIDGPLSISRVVGVSGLQSNGASYAPKISADGRFVVFATEATNFVSGDSNSKADIILYEISSGISSVVSMGMGFSAANGDSISPSISKFGDFICFESAASNLVPGDLNERRDIFRYRKSDGVIQRVSLWAGAELGSDSTSCSISGDGSKVAFQSNIAISPSLDAFMHIFRTDLSSGSTILVSKSPSSGSFDGDAFAPAITLDGHRIYFSSNSSALVANDVNAATDIFEYMDSEASWRLISCNQNVSSNGVSHYASANSNGRYVSFVSSARNLSREFNCSSWAFIKDTVSGRVGLIAPPSAIANSRCLPTVINAAISSDGKRLVSIVSGREFNREIWISSNPLFRD